MDVTNKNGEFKRQKEDGENKKSFHMGSGGCASVTSCCGGNLGWDDGN